MKLKLALVSTLLVLATTTAQATIRKFNEQ